MISHTWPMTPESWYERAMTRVSWGKRRHDMGAVDPRSRVVQTLPSLVRGTQLACQALAALERPFSGYSCSQCAPSCHTPAPLISTT